MNKNTFRLVYCRLRGMLVAVAETAVGRGGGGRRTTPSVAIRSLTLFAMRDVAFAALALFGLAPGMSDAQIVPSGAHAPGVIGTANGLPQVNITKPSGAGVSLNTFSQFDVSKQGAILNNSPVITGTQLAGQISGNPNFGPSDTAKIIVNQVNSNNPSQLRGYVEVAGQKTAAVVIANSSGLVVDGGGFINTSKGILTTGNPLIDGSGNLTGFNVTGGTITVQGAGLNGSNIDEVDLLARAVQANAAIYANTLNVTTGSNNIDYASLTPTRIAGSGPAPAVSIDVAQLGGMYANRITLVGNENGVGVANAGTIAAQAGDLTLSTSGQLVQSGKMTASGNVDINAGSFANSGTVYAQQNTTIGSSGALTNSGTLAAQRNITVNAGSVDSTGTLGAGVNNDGSVGNSGDLDVSAVGQLSATGENVAGGNASLSGSGVNLAGSETAANGNVSLTANAGDLNLAGATTSAGGSIVAYATGTLDNDKGSLTGGGVTLNAGILSNQGGVISAQGPLVAQASRQLTNQGGSIVSQGAMQVSGGVIANEQGTIQSAASLSVAGTSLDSTAGRITSLNGDGLSVTTTGQLVNAAGTTATGAQGGVIGGNGAVALQGGTIANHGTVSAQTNLQVSAQSVDNSGGSLGASGNTTVNAGSSLTNSGGLITAGQTVTESATTLDNSAGSTQAAQVSLNATNLVNHAGTITQTGSGPMNVAVSGTLDNSAGGTLQTNSSDLTLAPATLDNDGGTIVHAGTGVLTLDAGAGPISNAGGTIQSNGQVVAQAGTLNNAAGLVLGQTGLTATVGNTVDNTNGKLLSNADLSLASGSLTNNGGQIVAPDLALAIGSTLDNSGGTIQANQLALSAIDLLNHGGTITQYGVSPMSVNASSTLDNSNGGTIQTNSTDLTLAPAILDNDGGTILAAGTGTVTIAPGNGSGSFSNVGGKITAAGDIVAQAGSLDNATGVLAAKGNIATNVAGNINNTQGSIRSLTSLSLASGGTLTNTNGQIQSGTGAAGDAGTLGIQAASIDNTGGLVSNLGTGNTTVQGGSRTINSGGAITGNGNVAVDTSSLSNTQGGQLSGASVAVQADIYAPSGFPAPSVTVGFQVSAQL
ncbi:filamentous hemagglutinin N-terminal domain-containing protein [Paraburkholderia sp. UYCP14C]|nr:filamentous hemagglutinin N-terminal domain-containing protein [Paraburkholderia sp. UYCP14C]